MNITCTKELSIQLGYPSPEMSFTATCPTDAGIEVSITLPEGWVYGSTPEEAEMLGTQELFNAIGTALLDEGCDCHAAVTGGYSDHFTVIGCTRPTTFYNSLHHNFAAPLNGAQNIAPGSYKFSDFHCGAYGCPPCASGLVYMAMSGFPEVQLWSPGDCT